jgi:hypothetical protein
MADHLPPPRSRHLILALLVCEFAVTGLAVALDCALCWAPAFRESPETRRL